MTISSSLNAGVAGLNANATRLATISDNIANASTFGYKRATADFRSMVFSGAGSGYTAGGVRVTSSRLVDERGPLVTTNNATDIAIDGRGMLPVTTAAALERNDGHPPLSLMTTGSFRPDANGILRTDTGMVLLGWPADVTGQIGSFPRDTTSGLRPVHVNLNQYASNPTTDISIGVNLPATGTAAGQSGDPIDMSIEYFGNLGTYETLTVSFAATVPVSGSSNEWTMTLTDSAQGGAVVGEYTLVFDDTRGGGGTLASVTTVSGGAYDPATGNIPMSLAGGGVNLQIGTLGQANGLTQLSDTFAPISITKNGSSVANLTAVEIDQNGYVHAIYDQGFSRRIFQIPLVDVPNLNGLAALNNQTYQVTPESGSYFLWDAGDGPTGSTVGFSREESATDIARELTLLIQTQRAYSSNAKVIQTVDEMMQETTNIKR